MGAYYYASKSAGLVSGLRVCCVDESRDDVNDWSGG